MAKVIIEVVSGHAGKCLYIGNTQSGYRLAGPKPAPGDKTIAEFHVDVDELSQCLKQYAEASTATPGREG